MKLLCVKIILKKKILSSKAITLNVAQEIKILSSFLNLSMCLCSNNTVFCTPILSTCVFWIKNGKINARHRFPISNAVPWFYIFHSFVTGITQPVEDVSIVCTVKMAFTVQQKVERCCCLPKSNCLWECGEDFDISTNDIHQAHTQ